MIGIVLNIVASIMKYILNFPVYTATVCVIVFRKGELNRYNRDLALAKDRYGNVLIRYIANYLLIKRGGYRFGNGKETISSVIGKNRLKDALTILGAFIYHVLNLLEKNHSEKAIDLTIKEDLK